MLVDGWLADPAEAADVIAAGHDLDEFRARSRELLVGQMAAARADVRRVRPDRRGRA